MAETVDIFTTIHTAIWDALKAWTPVTDVVDVRNLVDMTADDFDDFPPNTPDDATPEIAIIQSGWVQQSFNTGSAGVARSQVYQIIVTTGKLNPVEMNVVKEGLLDALIAKGMTLGLSQPVNGNRVTGWSVGGEDSLTSVEVTPGDERQAIRSQSVARVTVNFLKSISRQHT